MDVSIGQLLREHRKARGLTQVELADQVGVSDSQIARVEAGDRNLSESVLDRVIVVLKLNRAQTAAIRAARDEAATVVARGKLSDERMDRMEAAMRSVQRDQRDLAARLQGLLERLPEPPADRSGP